MVGVPIMVAGPLWIALYGLYSVLGSGALNYDQATGDFLWYWRCLAWPP